MTAFLLIKPEYAFAIFQGTKKYEFRKMRFHRDIKMVVVYATAPYKKIIGYFQVGEIHQGFPQMLWDKFNAYAGIDKAAFFSYFKNKSSGIAIEVKEPVSFRQHRKPREILPDFTIPWSFRYISEDEFELIKKTGA